MTLDSITESSPELAGWLGVDEVVLVREDRLPDGGGKKRRSLADFADTIEPDEEVHLLSYAGSHTAFTLARVLPNNRIVLYGTDYGGGRYQEAMTAAVGEAENVTQYVGPAWRMTPTFLLAQARAGERQRFLRFGGSMGVDPQTAVAAARVHDEVGPGFDHVVAVASGDLFNSIDAVTPRVTGVLTQPLLIRCTMYPRSTRLVGLRPAPLEERIDLMGEVRGLTGELWDPIFMGSVFHYLRRCNGRLPGRLCIWVTCPAGIAWLDSSTVVQRQGI